MKKYCILLGIALLATACGKRGPLIPPEALVPAPINDLRLEQKGDRFQVCWSAPRKEEWGGPLQDLAGFRVYRRTVLPEGEDCESCPEAYRPLKAVDPEYLQDVRQVGSLYCFFDEELTEGWTYQYKVQSMDRDGIASRDSNKARRTKWAAPAAPLISVRPTANGISLHWQQPVRTPGGTLSGYAVYRKQGGSLLPLAPIARVAATSTSFEDQQMEYGVLYDYVVRTITTFADETVESAPSNEVQGKFSLPED